VIKVCSGCNDEFYCVMKDIAHDCPCQICIVKSVCIDICDNLRLYNYNFFKKHCYQGNKNLNELWEKNKKKY
jgi:hypothetical protein